MLKSIFFALVVCTISYAASSFAGDAPKVADQPHSATAVAALHDYEKAQKDAELAYRTACLTAEHKLVDKLKVAIGIATKSGSLLEANAIDAQIKAANTRIDKLKSPIEAKVSLRFSDSGMGYSVAELRIGASITNNEDRPIIQLSPALSGKSFTQMVVKQHAPVGFAFVTAGKMYLLAADWEQYSVQQAILAKIAHEETDMEVKTSKFIYHVWSVTGDTGRKVEIPFNVALVADSLEKSDQIK